uniref:Uncharacterized mitochondrial protein AtMg00810-like n=1 Tax=Nicotiana tabacum TaxID=4097 RepID=A0A1S4CDH8_TOBAC|nr:PREDICTED: uncharacterized mitochondrial protein AtMg00810-like [Nicotiana tabacum]
MAANKAAQFIHSPSVNRWLAVKRILRYFKGTIDHGPILKPSRSPTLFAFSDADWGGDKIYRKSTSAYLVLHGTNVISWCSKKRNTIARSSTDLEYCALASTASEVYWLQ